MTDETKQRILKALETDYGNAADNAARARAARNRGVYSAAEAALFDRYEAEERAALAALKEYAPDWAPRRMFGG